MTLSHPPFSTSFSTLVAALASVALLGCSAAPGLRLRSPGAAVHDSPAHTAVIVRVRTPWYAPRFVVRRRFLEALPEYESNDDIVAKYFSISERNEFGGLYLWRTRAAAERHFDRAWRDGVRERRGAEPDVLILDAPLVVDGTALPLGARKGRRSIAYPAEASFVRFRVTSSDPHATAIELANRLARAPRLFRAFVTVEPSAVGAIALWADATAADEACEPRRRAEEAAALGAEPLGATRFEVPLLVDEALVPDDVPNRDAK